MNWIKCSERMPEADPDLCGRAVLVCDVESGRWDKAHWTGTRWDSFNWNCPADRDAFTHWAEVTTPQDWKDGTR